MIGLNVLGNTLPQIRYKVFLFNLLVFFWTKGQNFHPHNLHNFSISGKVIGYPHCFVSSFSLKRHISLRRFASRHASITHLETFPRLHSTFYIWRKPNKRFLWCNLYLKLPYEIFRKIKGTILLLEDGNNFLLFNFQPLNKHLYAFSCVRIHVYVRLHHLTSCLSLFWSIG